MSPADSSPVSAAEGEESATADTSIAILRLHGDIDIASEDAWRAEGDALLAADPALTELVVDMSEVAFLDSRGMAMLVHLYTQLVGRGGTLVLTAVPRRVARALTVAGLDQMFHLQVG